MGDIVHRKGGSLFGPLLSLNMGERCGLRHGGRKGKDCVSAGEDRTGRRCLAPGGCSRKSSAPAGHGAGASGARRPGYGEALCVSMHIQDSYEG